MRDTITDEPDSVGRVESAGTVGIGVVVPTLDEAAHLPRLLARLQGAGSNGSDRADEVVVADGGSGDGTRELAQSLGARVIAAPRGRGAQLAAGVEHVAAEVLLFLHADCVPEPGALAVLRRAFADPALGASAMRQRIAAEGAFYRLVESAANARARRGMVLGDSGLAIRRELYHALGGFRPVGLFEDVDFSRRLRRRCRVKVLGGAGLSVSARRWQREGALRCTLRNWMLRLMYEAGIGPERLARLYPPHSPHSPPTGSS